MHKPQRPSKRQKYGSVTEEKNLYFRGKSLYYLPETEKFIAFPRHRGCIIEV